MGTSISPVYICSAALVKLGATSILSLTDGSPRAQACNRLWPVVRDAVLSARNWGVAYNRQTLTKDDEAPAFDFLAKFRLPTDCFILLSTDLPRDARYQIEGDFLLCDYETVSVLYIKATPDTTTYGPLLVDALVSTMAYELAMPITGSKAVADAMDEERERKLGVASQRESQQRSPVALTSDILVRVRR